MPQDVETFCALIERWFHARQRVIYTMGMQLTAEDVVLGLRQEEPQVRSWMQDMLRIGRDMVACQDAVPPACPVIFGSILLGHLASEVDPGRVLFRSRGKAWTASDLARTVMEDPAVAREYSDALCQVVSHGFAASARTSPKLRKSCVYDAELNIREGQFIISRHDYMGSVPENGSPLQA